MWLQIGKTPLEINPDTYLGDKEIYCIFKDILHNLCFLFQKNYLYFINLPFLCSNYTFFINQNFNSHPNRINVNRQQRSMQKLYKIATYYYFTCRPISTTEEHKIDCLIASKDPWFVDRGTPWNKDDTIGTDK
jgi:hypothetical protein